MNAAHKRKDNIMTEQNQNENFEIETIEETQAFETSADAETENFTDELETERKLPDTQMLEVKNTLECKNCETVLERNASVLNGQFSRKKLKPKKRKLKNLKKKQRIQRKMKQTMKLMNPKQRKRKSKKKSQN